MELIDRSTHQPLGMCPTKGTPAPPPKKKKRKKKRSSLFSFKGLPCKQQTHTRYANLGETRGCRNRSLALAPGDPHRGRRRLEQGLALGEAPDVRRLPHLRLRDASSPQASGPQTRFMVLWGGGGEPPHSFVPSMRPWGCFPWLSGGCGSFSGCWG